ncbi:hypothetical protein ZTR_09448 [Talaromyces verruculosus]|nr:hypothetical protein ZTR_09448 [Talaromyces verruculosus]
MAPIRIDLLSKQSPKVQSSAIHVATLVLAAFWASIQIILLALVATQHATGKLVSLAGLAKQVGLELDNKVGEVAVNPDMETSDPHIYAVGDATATATLDRIAQIGGVGLSVNSSRALGRNYQYVTVRPLHHSGYDPGAENVTVRLAFENMTGKLLGAQLVRKAGVDKRVDVLATAMQADMTVFDL